MEFISEEAAMSKTYLPYDPDQQLLLPAALHCRMTIWPTSSPTWWTNWTCGGRLCRQSPPATREKGGVAHLTILG